MRESLIVASNAWYFDERGGADKIATDLAIHCAGRGRRVHYICSHDGRAMETSDEEGVQIWRYPRPKSGLGGLANLMGHCRAVRSILKSIRGIEGPDRCWLLNGHTALHHLLLVEIATAVRRNVVSVHSPMTEEYLAGNKGSGLRWKKAGLEWFLHRMEGRCYARSDAVQCFSRFTRGHVMSHFRGLEERLVVCPGYVDIERFSGTKMPREEARRRLGPPWDTDAVIFFSLRRHVERMGLDTLIRACVLVRERYSADGTRPGFRLILGGDGHLKKRHEELVAALALTDVVRFTGSIAETEVPLAYRAADCSVLPTRTLECFGLVLLEAFAAGTPVIGTPVGAIPEVMGPYAEEWLTAGTDERSLSDALLEFLRTHPRVSETGLRAYAARFDKKSVLPRLERIVIGTAEAD